MEPLSSALSLHNIAWKCIDQFIKEQGYGRLASWLFPKRRYKVELAKIIYCTIAEFEKLYPHDGKNVKFPFYHSHILFEDLINHVLFKKDQTTDILNKFKHNPNIEIPSNNELSSFFSLFAKNVKSNKKLKKLYIDENYQSEIFELSIKLDDIVFEITSLIKDEFQQISKQINSIEAPVLVEGFLDRKEEEELLTTINSKNVLLLSGISLCGKSQMAKKIAELFVAKGFKYANRSDINEAERFLRSTNEPIILVLEDPFGHNSEDKNSSSWRKVIELIRNLHSSHKLIITSRIDVLKNINNTSTIDECAIEGHEWIDLTSKDKDFLIKLWNDQCTRKCIPENVKSIINQYLRDASLMNLLQSGQLNHLSNLPTDILIKKTLEELLYFARVDSKEISDEIIKRGSKSYELFLILGLTASTNISVHLDEIGYILNESKILPGFHKRLPHIRSFSFSNFSNSNAKFPSYQNGINLGVEYLEELGFLQSRGFIEVLHKAISFTHPIYKEAARYLFLLTNINHLESFKRLLEKTLSCLKTETALNCAKQLFFIYRSSKNNDLREILKKNSINCLERSIFPSVRDISFLFLLEIHEDLNSTEKELVLRKINEDNSTSNINWIGEVPFIDPDTFKLLDDEPKKSTKEIENLIEELNINKKVSASDIWDVLISLKHKESGIFPNITGVLNILNCDEVFIRNFISYLTLKILLHVDKAILDAIFKDSHPSVIFAGLKGSLLGFPNYTEYQQNLIKPYLFEALSNEFVIIRANDLVSTFGIDYGNDSIDWDQIPEIKKKKIWELWGELFPVFLNNYPRKLSLPNSGRFSTTLNESEKYLSSEIGLKISFAYYSWIDEYLIHEGMLDTYELGVLNYLIDITYENKESRFELFQKIFSHLDTSFIIYSLSWSLSLWGEMTQLEKKVVLELLGKKRIDQRWLVATALTQHTIPDEIQQLILGTPNIFEKDVGDLIHRFESGLLNDCLSIFCAYPPQLWQIGIHHHNGEFWYKVIKWILRNEFSIGFDICLREMVSDGVNGFSEPWEDGFEIWTHLCQNSKNRNILARRLIFETANCSCNIKSAQQLWHILIDSYSNEKEELKEMIVANIEALQRNHPEDILDFFDRGFLENEILPLLTFDNSLISFLVQVEKGKITSKEQINNHLNELMESSFTERLRLDITFNIISNLIQKKGKDYPEIEKLQQIKNYIRHPENSKIEREEEYYELENWNSVYKPPKA